MYSRNTLRLAGGVRDRYGLTFLKHNGKLSAVYSVLVACRLKVELKLVNVRFAGCYEYKTCDLLFSVC